MRPPQDPCSRAKLQACVDLLIHPRRPPPARSLPFELLTADETKDGTTTHRAHGSSQRKEKTEPHLKLPERFKALESIRAPSQVHESQARLPSPHPSQYRPNAPPSPPSNSATYGDNFPVKPNTPPRPVPSIVQHSPAPQSQIQAPKLVDSAPAILIADDNDDEELPSIDLDSDSDSDS